MNQLNEPVFTETSKEKIAAVLYQAMFDETIRLRKCHSRAERRDIRDFLTTACRVCMQQKGNIEQCSLVVSEKHEKQ
nr:MAG TPA: hypothetical protein [Bacteriophage sp.]